MKTKTCFASKMTILCLAYLVALSGYATPSSAQKTVLNFGAAGDGVKDDWSALQSALYAGGTVVLPPGRYRITKSLFFSNGSSLVGSRDSVIVLDSPSIEITGRDVKNVTVKGFSIERSTPGDNPALSFFDSSNIEIEDLYIANNRSLAPAILIQGRFEGTTEETTSHTINVQSTVIENYQRVGIGGLGPGDNQGIFGTGIAVVFSKHFVISDNIIIDRQGLLEPSEDFINVQSAGINVISSLYGTVTGNVIEWTGQGIDVGGGKQFLGQTTASGMRGSQWITVSGNTIDNAYGVGIKLVNGASFNTITGNAINRAGLVGIWLTPGTDAGATGTLVRGNVISSNIVTNVGDGIGRFVWARPNSSRNSGIVIEPAEPPASAPTENIIVGNLIIDTQPEPTTTYGITNSGVFEYGHANFPKNNLVEANKAFGTITASVALRTSASTSDCRRAETLSCAQQHHRSHSR